jgi:hypothetical protein
MSKAKKTSKKSASRGAAKRDPDLVPLKEALKPAAKGAKAKPAKERRPSGLDAAAQVLKAKGEPMTCGAMVDAMLARKLWSTDGKTPAATIYSAILRECARKGDKSRFKKTDRGLFAFNGK